MNESHFLRNALLAVAGVIVVGWLAIALIGWVFHIAIYLVVGALIIGGGIYLYGRAKRSLSNGSFQRRIGR